jgi:uncharacterized membrane protein YeiH
MFHLLDIIGTIAALSGALTASKKKMDGLHIYSCFRDGCRGGTCAMS